MNITMKTIYKNILTRQDSIRVENSWWNEWLREPDNFIIKTNQIKKNNVYNKYILMISKVWIIIM